MRRNFRLAIIVTLIAVFLVTTVSSAQYSGYGWGTVYQLVNIGNAPTDVIVEYYDANGNKVKETTIADLGVYKSQLVVQPRDDTELTGGQLYSAVIRADQPIAATVNEELYAAGVTTTANPPFASYSGVADSDVGTEIFLPAAMYNWYNYYTEFVIMNATGSDITVDIAYTPSTMNGTVAGKTGVTQNDLTIHGYSSILVSQKDLSTLGATSGTYAGRFYGNAKVTATGNITVVVNQHNAAQYKLMTYNGVTSGSTSIAVPSHMRGYFKYYTATTITNMSSTNKACVRLTYTPDTTRSTVTSGSKTPVVVERVLDAGASVIRYDGPDASDDQSDLDDNPIYSQFYGSILVESFNGTVGGVACTNAPVTVVTNIESTASGDDQGGSYNGISTIGATHYMISPNILADFYGIYTNLTVQNLESDTAHCTITYTSGPDSTVPNQSKSYAHDIPGYGVLTVYEGRKGNIEIGDINHDSFWKNAQGIRRFIGTAVVSCDNNIVGFTNEEKDIAQRDSMYTYNNVTLSSIYTP